MCNLDAEQERFILHRAANTSAVGNAMTYSYESRNECRLGRFGNIGYPLKAERQYEELYNSIKRWTWRDKPTRKAKKIQALEAKMDAYEGAHQ